MNRLQLLFTKLAEEAAEIAQISLKCQQFGLDETWSETHLSNKIRLHDELDDLNAIVQMLNKEFEFNYVRSQFNVEKKIQKVNKYCKHSQELGLVDV